jgi:hypothetical protein
MSQANVELVRRGIEAINRGDVEGALAMADVAPEFEFVPLRGPHPRPFGRPAGT